MITLPSGPTVPPVSQSGPVKRGIKKVARRLNAAVTHSVKEGLSPVPAGVSANGEPEIARVPERGGANKAKTTVAIKPMRVSPRFRSGRWRKAPPSRWPRARSRCHRRAYKASSRGKEYSSADPTRKKPADEPIQLRRYDVATVQSESAKTKGVKKTQSRRRAGW